MRRIDYGRVAPGVHDAMNGLESYVHGSGLDPRLVELVKARVSQVNGCAYCIDLHTRRARELGETEQRLYALDAWREGPFFDARERAALAWAEAVTRLGEDRVSDAAFREAREHFGEKALVDLTLAVVAINGWNRLSIAFRAQPEVRAQAPAAATGARS